MIVAPQLAVEELGVLRDGGTTTVQSGADGRIGGGSTPLRSMTLRPCSECDFSGISHNIFIWNFPLTRTYKTLTELTADLQARCLSSSEVVRRPSYRRRSPVHRLSFNLTRQRRGTAPPFATSRASPALPSGTSAFATSLGSVGALLPLDAGIFVQIGVSMTRGRNLEADAVAGCRTFHRDSLPEKAHAALRRAMAGQTC